MEKSFSIFGHRRQIIEDNLELLLELHRILYDPEGLPYLLERHGQMRRKIAGAREEIAFLTEEIALAEAKRQRRLAQCCRDRRERGAEAVAGDVEVLSRVGVRFLAVF